MKKIVVLVFLLFITVISFAQEWQTNYDEAKTLALKENKDIVLVFQGSDWCAPCMKLDKQVWSTEEFQKLANDKFIMLKADFPKRKGNKLSPELKEQNNNLAEKYNPNGYFPFVVVLSKEEVLLGNAGYEKVSPSAYFKKLIAFTK